MPTASDVLPENPGGPAVTKPEATNVETTGNLDEEEDVAAPAQPYAEYVDPAKSSKRFGLKGSAPFRPPKGNDPFNYEEKYPEDAYGEEMGANARIFRTYIDERAIHDTNMVEESRDGVDVLLVFAGLFSAVVTTFVAQTSQSLQADYSEMSANLLFEMINIQRAIASGASLDAVTPSPLNPSIPFIASATSVWVNGLWFTSLALSLTTALVSVLVKQWLHHYMALPSGTPRERSLLRQFRYAGLQKWRVLVIIGLLPVLMHTALAIFFVGLVIFLGPLRDSLAWVVGTVTAAAYMAYLMAHVLPLFFPQCPYRTSLCDLLHILYGYVMEYAIHPLRHHLRRPELGPSEMDMCVTLPDKSASTVAKWKDLKKLESDAVKSVSGELSIEALHWLFSMSSNPTVQSIVIQAIGGLHPALQEKAKGLFNDIGLVEQLFGQCTYPMLQSWDRTPVAGLEMKLERLLRCNLVLRCRLPFFINVPDTPSVELPLCAMAPVEMHAPQKYLFIREVFRNAAMSLSGHESWCFHPVVWINLIRDAEYFPVDITDDPFGIDLCRAVLPTLTDSPQDEFDSRKDIAQSSDKPISFNDAIRQYIFADITTYLLRVFAVFVHPSNVPSITPSLRILWVFAEFLISRLTLEEQVDRNAAEFQALAMVLYGISLHDLSSSEANNAISKVLDCFITDTLKSSWLEAYPYLYSNALRAYTKQAQTRWHTISPRSLEAVVNFMFDHYNFEGYVPGLGVIDERTIIAEGLCKGSPTMYSVFHAARCLEYFGYHGYRPWMVEIVKGYLSSFGRHSKSCLENSVIQEHIEYLHTPNILFHVCSILAVGANVPDGYGRRQIKKNILSLVQIRPDAPAWDECRCRLQKLLEEDGMDFFHRQAYVRGIEQIALSEERIAEQREYIRFAIEVLDAFFSGQLEDEPLEEEGGLDAAPTPQTGASWSDRLHHLLPWHGHEETSDDAAKRV